MPSHPDKRFRRELVLLFLIPAFTSCIGVPSGGDADEAHNVRTLLVQRYPFVPRQVTLRVNGNPGEDGVEVYWSPLSYRSNLFIYGILDANEQDQIVGILDEIRSTKRLKPILAFFYSNKNQDDRPHHVIRKVMIRDPKPYDEKPEDY